MTQKATQKRIFWKNKMIKAMVALCALLIVSFLLHRVSDKDKRIESLNHHIVELEQKAKLVDSLEAELFPKEIELNRFQVAFEIFARRHPVYAEIYATIISNETE